MSWLVSGVYLLLYTTTERKRYIIYNSGKIKWHSATADANEPIVK